jgi:CarD family transcriptional regulator
MIAKAKMKKTKKAAAKKIDTRKKPAARLKTKPAAKVKPAPKAKTAVKPVAKSAAAKTGLKQMLKAAMVKTAAAKAHAAKHAVAAKHPTPVAAKPVAPAVAAKPVATAPAVPKKPSFKIGEQVVYPAHGVGRVTNIEEQEIAGVKLELYIVDFEKEKLRLKVPTNRAEQKGMRHLADRTMIEQAMKVIRGRARIKRVMWSRRAQEYDAKINSGDMIAVAEVVRDLYRSDRQPEQSYSERQLFEQALARFARELAAVRKIDDDQCIKELEDFLARNAKRAAADKAEEAAEEEAA